ncbi:hypothetical protein Taro_053485, partial [Colocasia esculenta]|nr:hypothetical protein [Colocasia esculenta]
MGLAYRFGVCWLKGFDSTDHKGLLVKEGDSRPSWGLLAKRISPKRGCGTLAKEFAVWLQPAIMISGPKMAQPTVEVYWLRGHCLADLLGVYWLRGLTWSTE